MKKFFKIFFESQNSLEGLLPGEKTIFLARVHPASFYFEVFPLIAFAFFPIFVFYFLKNIPQFPIFSSLFWFLSFCFWSFLWFKLFYILMLYSLSVLVLTNKRIIRIQTKGFFNHEREEAQLENIQEIMVKIKGIGGTLFHYGDIEIQTAGAKVLLCFRNFKAPNKIKEEIFKAKNALLQPFKN
ncbi:PH domain-containing protein [Candidatus Parcubacteria bacterium]|nr:PH domain-containing protein [Candidatus Parcubacteria bacterium]